MSVAIIPDYPGLMIENIAAEESPMRVLLTSHATMAPCPRCGLPSTRVCGRYQRILDDLPWGTAAITLHLQVQRFRCETPTCSQKIFCERIPWAPVYQRRTAAFIQRVLSLAWEMSASAARRVAEAAGIRVSRSTINRWILKTAAGNPVGAEAPGDREVKPLTIVGIDDWAWKKGQRYGTVVVDLETHRPVDVLADRSAETVATWLRDHPTIQVISRDRGGAYARGAREGAPHAQQVADRFHLLKNWHDHTAALIGPWEPSPVPAHDRPADPREIFEEAGARPCPPEAAASPLKQARWAAIHQLWDQGLSITAIAQQVHCDPKTVRKDLAAVRPRATASPAHRPDPSENHVLQELWHGQRLTAQELWEAAKQQ